jgi:hypothetical protein
LSVVKTWFENLDIKYKNLTGKLKIKWLLQVVVNMHNKLKKIFATKCDG